MAAEEKEALESEAQGQTEATAEAPTAAAGEAEKTAEASAEDKLPPVEVAVEEAGPLRKKLTITVPQERIDAKRDETLKQLAGTAQVPGFRIGRAPRRLIEKRFGTEMQQDIRTQMIAQGYTQAIEKAKLKVLGEPEMSDEKLAAIKLPETGPLTFDLEVEIQPEFELPALEGIPVKRPAVEIGEEMVDGAIKRLQANYATLETVDEPAKADDVLTADLTFQVEGGEKHEHAGEQVAVRGQALEGIPLEDLGEKLAGAAVGQTITVETTVPDGHPKEEFRGKKATFTFAVKHVKRVKMPEIDEHLATRFGFDKLSDLRDWTRERLRAESSMQQQRAMREQVYDYLLTSVKLDLPEGVLGRMKERTLVRRANELMMQGIPKAEIEKHIDELSVHASEEAARELKTLFIMQRVAESLKVTVSEQEVNSLIARMAAQYNRRPDSVRADLERKDALGQLYVQIQEQKAIDLLLAKAKVKDAAATGGEAAGEGEAAKQ